MGDGDARVARLKAVEVGEILVEVLLTGEDGAPRCFAPGAVVGNTEHNGAAEIS